MHLFWTGPISRILSDPTSHKATKGKTIIYLVPLLPSGSSGTRRFCPPEVVAESSTLSISEGSDPSLRSGRSILQLPSAGKIGARPCMRVRICSLHLSSCLETRPSHSLGAIFPFRKKSSLWSPLSSRTAGVTRYLFADSARQRQVKLAHVRTFLSSHVESIAQRAWRKAPQCFPVCGAIA